MSDDATADLNARYKTPHSFVSAKCLDHVDRHGRRFIELSPFAAVASVGPGGSLDVSPRGGGPGFVRVAEDGRKRLVPSWRAPAHGWRHDEGCTCDLCAALRPARLPASVA